MKSLTQILNESLNKQTLPNEFKTTLTHLFNDYNKNFESQYSLNFIYNILAEACKGKKVIVLGTAYDENGKRKENENKLFSLKAGKNILEFIQDNYNQIKIYENNDYIDLFGSGWDNELEFGLKLIEILQDTNNFKIKKHKYSNTQFENDFGFSPKTYPNLKYDIQMYDVNSWKVVKGFFNNKDRTESWGNNLQSYIIYPNSSEFEPLYSCSGAGSHGYKESYDGTDKNKFKETVIEILENHVHLKRK